jgi:hypothetical protein
MIDNEPKILFLDIETSPIVAYTWGPKWETNLIECLEQSQILCYSAKWLNGKQVTKGLIDYTGYKKNVIDDKKMVLDIYNLLDKADIVVTQNGIAFDHKVINARLLKHKLSPPSPYKMIDTRIEAKRYLKLPSYSLDDMGKYFDIGKKVSHEGFELWKNCILGDKKAWNLMKKYNAKDVLLAEQLYLKIRPFIKTHPNLNSYTDKGKCPKCGSENVHANGYIVNSSAKYHRAHCQSCGGWFRFGKPIKNTRPKDRQGTNA